MPRLSVLIVGGAVLFLLSAGAAVADPPAVPAPAPAAASHVDAYAIASDLNARRGKLFRTDDLAGVAALYTENADYIELLPILQRFAGRAEIQGHLEQLRSVDAIDIAPIVLEAEASPNGTIRASGDYIVYLADKPEVAGHFMQILRNDNGVWRIALHVFARSAAITESEYPRD